MTKDLQPFYNTADSTTKAELFTTEHKGLLQQHAPVRNITVRDKHTPWMSNEIIRAVDIRNLAYILYSRNPNRARGDFQWIDYTRKKKRVNTRAKKRYTELQFDHNLPTKKL